MQKPMRLSVTHSEQMQEILNEACDIFEVSPEMVKSKIRKGEYVKVRHLCFYVSWNLLSKKVPLRLIGQFFGGYDHTSVVHGRDVVKGYIDSKDPWFYDEWQQYIEKSVIWKNYLAA